MGHLGLGTYVVPWYSRSIALAHRKAPSTTTSNYSSWHLLSPGFVPPQLFDSCSSTSFEPTDSNPRTYPRHYQITRNPVTFLCVPSFSNLSHLLSYVLGPFGSHSIFALSKLDSSPPTLRRIYFRIPFSTRRALPLSGPSLAIPAANIIPPSSPPYCQPRKRAGDRLLRS
ncbi:hypothetical protein SODALDRAFT_78809 [Sodiomyces alkalinus F11]|uniref:Uncharacterized protein n=1 Tax=Sodiomyces alkalinus (strain CBS 110278 / VKM F-3762 / F11) TaxID=1314773 RepID=A0A3N2PLF9_SODAK|nr:hypothetical protein SODALDRAFT_78809 [Sodiomyces alkalinus F11]ROT35176.1 hypothetical protein SODALDRAFT_78809 [Sodiomyces alkalinus F11]